MQIKINRGMSSISIYSSDKEYKLDEHLNANSDPLEQLLQQEADDLNDYGVSLSFITNLPKR